MPKLHVAEVSGPKKKHTTEVFGFLLCGLDKTIPSVFIRD